MSKVSQVLNWVLICLLAILYSFCFSSKNHILLYIFHLLSYSWSLEVLSDQLYCFSLFFMFSYWYIIMQSNYLCSQYIIFRHMHFSFFIYYTIYFPSLFIFQYLYPCLFISFIALTTSLFFTFDFLTFSNKSIPFTIISTLFIFLTFSHLDFANISSSLSLSTSTFQSSLLFKLSAFSILLSKTCFSIKLNLNRYNAYFACFLFNFCVFIKYSRFL